MIERQRLINKWMNEANMQIQSESVKDNFKSMLECFTDMELVRPFIIRDRKVNSYSELSIKYGVKRDNVIQLIQNTVRKIVERNKK